MEQTECSKTLAYKIQMPENYPEENIQHTEHGESLKSRIVELLLSILNLLVKAPNILMHTNSPINKYNVNGMSIYSGTQNSNMR
jgi:hypothetical protein